MKRSIKYLIVLVVVLLCVYGFWMWLQYKGATIIKQTTASIIAELQKVEKIETATQTLTKTIEGEQQLASLVPGIGINEIIGNSLFKDKMTLTVTGEVHAGYILKNISTGDIQISRDGSVTINLGEPEIFDIVLSTGSTETGILQSGTITIITQKEKTMEATLRQKAGELIIQEALSGTLLQEAKNNAQNKLQDILLKANIQIKEIRIKGTGDIQP